MSYFFLSNRKIIQPRNKNKSKRFGDDFSSTPSFVIAPKKAKTLNPDDRLTGPGRAKRWAEAVIEAAGGPKGDGHIVFFVHGFNNNAKDAFKTHKKFLSSLKKQGLKKTAFVTFAWPSEGDVLQYLEDDGAARKSALDLVKFGIELFAQVREPGCRIRVHVIAHSMGTLVVREAFRAAEGRPSTRENAWGISQLIFFGADISSRSIKSDVAEPLFRKSQRFTNYFNRHDAALATSNVKRFFSSRRLGRHGTPENMLDKVADVDVSEHWKMIAKTNNASPRRDKLLSHNFYRDDPTFCKDVVHTLEGDMDRRNTPNRKPHKEAGRLKLVK